MKIRLLTAILVLFTISLAAQNKSEIEKCLKKLSQENNVPGINFSMIDKQGIQSDFSSGYADKHTRQNLTPYHHMFSGSIGKTYAFAVLMQLVDEGKIDLSKILVEYFPDVEWLSRVPNINQFTVEMLARHTSGLPRYAMKSIVWKMCHDNPDKVWSIKDRMEIVFDDEPAHAAGEEWFYSDTGYILLGFLIERITGKPLYEVVKERITEPYNLSSTIPADSRDLPNMAIGYSDLDSSFYMPKEIIKNGRVVFNPQLEFTGGGYINSTGDLAKWGKLLYEQRLFSDSLYTKMITPVKPGLDIDEGLSYGMGSFIYDTELGTAYGHTGFMPGYKSIMIYFPETKLSVAMQLNCDYGTKNISLIEYVTAVLKASDSE